MQNVLNIVVESQLLVCLCARVLQLSTLCLGPFVVVRPYTEVWLVVSLTQITVLCLGYKRIFVSRKPLLESSRVHNVVAFLYECNIHVVEFCLQCGKIVVVGQGIELLSLIHI